MLFQQACSHTSFQETPVQWTCGRLLAQKLIANLKSGTAYVVFYVFWRPKNNLESSTCGGCWCQVGHTTLGLWQKQRLNQLQMVQGPQTPTNRNPILLSPTWFHLQPRPHPFLWPALWLVPPLKLAIAWVVKWVQFTHLNGPGMQMHPETAGEWSNVWGCGGKSQFQNSFLRSKDIPL